MANPKLRPYFEAYKVIILTDQPLKNVLQRLDISSWLLKWVVELSQHDVVFIAQALADFLAERIAIASNNDPQPRSQNLYTDGSSTKDGSGTDLIIESPGRGRHEHALFKVFNNEAEYEP